MNIRQALEMISSSKHVQRIREQIPMVLKDDQSEVTKEDITDACIVVGKLYDEYADSDSVPESMLGCSMAAAVEEILEAAKLAGPTNLADVKKPDFTDLLGRRVPAAAYAVPRIREVTGKILEKAREVQNER